MKGDVGDEVRSPGPWSHGMRPMDFILRKPSEFEISEIIRCFMSIVLAAVWGNRLWGGGINSSQWPINMPF